MCGTDGGGIGGCVARTRRREEQPESSRGQACPRGRGAGAVPGETRAAGCAGRAIGEMDTGWDEQGNAMRKREERRGCAGQVWQRSVR
jgi:hypothetical protein